MVDVPGTVVVSGGTGTVTVIPVEIVSGGWVTVVGGSVSVIGTDVTVGVVSVVVADVSVVVATVPHGPRWSPWARCAGTASSSTMIPWSRASAYRRPAGETTTTGSRVPRLGTANERDQLVERPLPDEIVSTLHTQRGEHGANSPLDRPDHLRLDLRTLVGEIDQDDVADLEPLNLDIERHQESVFPLTSA